MTHEADRREEEAYIAGRLSEIERGNKRLRIKPFQKDIGANLPPDFDLVREADNEAFWGHYIGGALALADDSIIYAQWLNKELNTKDIASFQQRTLELLEERLDSFQEVNIHMLITEIYLSAVSSFTWSDNLKQFSEIVSVTRDIEGFYRARNVNHLVSQVSANKNE